MNSRIWNLIIAFLAERRVDVVVENDKVTDANSLDPDTTEVITSISNGELRMLTVREQDGYEILISDTGDKFSLTIINGNKIKMFTSESEQDSVAVSASA